MQNFLQQQSKAISVKMDVELLAREVKSGRPPSLHHPARMKSVRAEKFGYGPPAMADGDGLDRKIGKYAEHFSVMAARHGQK